LSTTLFTQSSATNVIDKFLNFVKAKLDELFVTILQRQQEIILFSNRIKNFDNKLDLFILFIILSSSNFEDTTSLKLFFDFKNNTLSNSINFNKSFKVIKLLNTF